MLCFCFVDGVIALSTNLADAAVWLKMSTFEGQSI